MTNACRSLDPVLLQGRRCQYSGDYGCAIVLVISCNLVGFFVAFVIFLGTASFPCCHVTILTMWTSMSMYCRLGMCSRFSNFLHFGGLFPCFCDFSRSSLVSMLQDRGPGINPLKWSKTLDFEVETAIFLIRAAK